MKISFITIVITCFTSLFAATETSGPLVEKPIRTITLHLENKIDPQLQGKLVIKIKSLSLTDYNGRWLKNITNH